LAPAATSGRGKQLWTTSKPFAAATGDIQGPEGPLLLRSVSHHIGCKALAELLQAMLIFSDGPLCPLSYLLILLIGLQQFLTQQFSFFFLIPEAEFYRGHTDLFQLWYFALSVALSFAKSILAFDKYSFKIIKSAIRG
jgi:hypothetical protein